MRPQKRILTVQDISCVGQCSLTVALPILSSCGVETSVIPSAVLSTHTGNWKDFTFRDLTDDIPSITKHWIDNNITFDGLYTGYIGNARQFELIDIIRKNLLREGAPMIIDPAMADNGRLYFGFDDAFVAEMKKFVSSADYLLPNITEAALLTDMPFKTEYGEDYISELIEKLHAIGAKNIVLTGVSFSTDKLGACYSDGSTLRYHFEERLNYTCHGTGDVFASVFSGRIVNGFGILDAVKDACVFVCEAMKNTNVAEHPYGTNFESVLYKLNKNA